MIKAIIFDVGGVLLRTADFSGRRLWEAELNLDVGGAEYYVFNSEMGRKAQLGQASTAELWDWIGAQFNLSQAGLQTFRHDFWRGDQLDLQLVGFIRALKSRYKTAIISNYADCLREELTTQFAIADAFDEILISAEEGVMKPEPIIYQRALSALRVAPQEAIFIDDFAQNVAAAEALGIHGILFHPQIDLAQELGARGVVLPAAQDRDAKDETITVRD